MTAWGCHVGGLHAAAASLPRSHLQLRRGQCGAGLLLARIAAATCTLCAQDDAQCDDIPCDLHVLASTRDGCTVAKTCKASVETTTWVRVGSLTRMPQADSRAATPPCANLRTPPFFLLLFSYSWAAHEAHARTDLADWSSTLHLVAQWRRWPKDGAVGLWASPSSASRSVLERCRVSPFHPGMLSRCKRAQWLDRQPGAGCRACLPSDMDGGLI